MNVNPIRLCFSLGTLCLALAIGGCAHEPLFVEYPYDSSLSSPGQEFSALPPAVQATVRAQVGAAQMDDITKLTDPGKVVYRITFEDSEQFPALYVAPDGSVLYPESYGVAVGAGNEDLGAVSGGGASGLELSDLPPPVVTTIQEAAPSGEVASIQKFTVGGVTYYEVYFKKGTPPRIRVEEKGALLQ